MQRLGIGIGQQLVAAALQRAACRRIEGLVGELAFHCLKTRQRIARCFGLRPRLEVIEKLLELRIALAQPCLFRHQAPVPLVDHRHDIDRPPFGDRCDADAHGIVLGDRVHW